MKANKTMKDMFTEQLRGKNILNEVEELAYTLQNLRKRCENGEKWAQKLTKEDLIDAVLFERYFQNNEAIFMNKAANLYTAFRLGLEKEEFGDTKASYINDMLAAMNLPYNSEVYWEENMDEEFMNFAVYINGTQYAIVTVDRLYEIAENFAGDEEELERCSELFFNDKQEYKKHWDDWKFVTYVAALGEYVTAFEMEEWQIVYKVQR